MLQVEDIESYQNHNQLVDELIDMHDEQIKKFTTVLAEKDTSLEGVSNLILAGRVFADINLVLFGEIRKLRRIVQDNGLQSEYKG